MASLTSIDPFSVNGIDPFEDVLKGIFRPVSLERYAQPSVKIDVQENESEYILHAELPGVSKEDIHVTIDGSTVAISAEAKREHDVKDGNRTLRSERYFGKVSRSVVLEAEIDESRADAEYKDGVLQLTLPKKAATAAKRLTIK